MGASMKAHIYPKGCYFNSVEDIKGSHITVMGLGLNGGGEAVVRFLLKHGAYVLVTDMKTEEQLKPTIDSIAGDKSLDMEHLTYVLGGHREEDFKNADVVIKNPGVKIEGNPYLAKAENIETDISLFLQFSKAPVIAVTGSKGKSSTVSAIHYGLREAGFKAFLGGNITVSPLTFLDETSGDTPAVLELSSWQLADLRGRGLLKPKIAVITKIVPDHQNWYGNMEDYVADKRLIYADQTSGDYLICDSEADEIGTGPVSGGTWGDFFAREAKSEVLRYGNDKLPQGTYGVWQALDSQNNMTAIARIPAKKTEEKILGSVKVPGRHMRQNAMNAALVLYLMGVDAERIQKILGSWTGIPHRLQYFYEWRNTASEKAVRFFNDSCSTVPEAAAAASAAFGKPVVLITGGTDKGLAFNVLTDALDRGKRNSTPPAAIYLLAGTGTDKIIPLLNESKTSFNGPYNSLDELLVAVKDDFADKSSFIAENDTVVFSPGCTSFGMFANEFDRGDRFMEKVKEIFGQTEKEE